MPIETTLRFADQRTADTEFLAVPFGPDLSAHLPPDVELPVPVDALLAHYAAKGEPGEVIEVPVAHGSTVRRVLLYGIGDGGAPALRRAGAAVARRAKGRESLSIAVPVADDVAPLAEGALLACYTFTIGESRSKAVETIVFPEGDEAALRRGEAVARATGLARDLVNTPACTKTPGWLADQAREVGDGSGLSVRVWDDSELGEFGGIRAVGQGSVNPPRLVRLSYTPVSTSAGGAEAGDAPSAERRPGEIKHVVLAGKGITFDSGGLSLKPTEGMKTMKTDMAGAATVIAAMSVLAAFEVPVRVTGLIACAENAISGSAQRPSDVITQYGGRTVEVLNTDAEGRLVLADLLAYADAQLDPDIMIDIATLTGAAKVALGLNLGALYANDESLADALRAAGEVSGDRLWRMPLVAEYRAELDSEVADLANVDTKSSISAGSITAALFLNEFTGKRAWAHLDIAGPARSSSDEGEITKGGTGFGVRLLVRYLASLAAQ